MSVRGIVWTVILALEIAGLIYLIHAIAARAHD